MAKVSEADKAKMRSLAASLREAEVHGPGSPSEHRRMLALVNAIRAEAGAAPFADDEEEPHELELYRRARALGMARTDH